MRLASCIDDLLHVHPEIGYFFMVVAAAIVAVWLVPWSLVSNRLSSSRTLAASDFLLFLVYLVVLLLLMVMTSRSATCLWGY